MKNWNDIENQRDLTDAECDERMETIEIIDSAIMALDKLSWNITAEERKARSLHYLLMARQAGVRSDLIMEFAATCWHNGYFDNPPN